MTSIEKSESPSVDQPEQDKLPLSLLNDLLYCRRRAALKVVEGVRSSNEHTARGDIVHENADLPGYEVAKGVTLLRALPVWSETLGLNGKCDIVEKRLDGSFFPVEFKVGRRRQWENDDVQLCAQALCLEEMLHITIPRGAIFHADSKRRREVEFTPELRERTRQIARELRAIIAPTELLTSKTGAPRLPAAEFKPACEECSLFDICLPKATIAGGRAKSLAQSLYET